MISDLAACTFLGSTSSIQYLRIFMVRVDARGITLNLSKYILLLKSNIISDQGKTAAPAANSSTNVKASKQCSLLLAFYQRLISMEEILMV